MEEKKPKTFAILSGFWLKIIAIVTMTIDHIGWMLSSNIGSNYWLAVVCRYVGRISLPLFCFLLVEGVLHTKKMGNYLLRLGIMATSITIALVVAVEALSITGIRNQGNIFIDLLIGALCVWALKDKRWYIKLLAVFPTTFAIAAFFVRGYETAGLGLIHWFPYFLRPQYDWLSLVLIVLFLFAHMFCDLFLETHSQRTGIPVESLKGTIFERHALNIISLGLLIVGVLFYFLMSYVVPQEYVYWDRFIQNMAVVSGAFILLYSGKRGYNAKWFQYGCYLYYPLHLLVIFGIGMLLTL